MEEALYKGNSHDNGGIKVLVDGSKPIEVEGHEYLLCNKAMQSTRIFEFKNKTNKEILDEFHTYSTCEFKQNEAHSGDFIICKKVVLDTNKRNITGTIKEIVNIMQSEKGCRQSNDDVFKTGGEIDEKEVENQGSLNLMKWYIDWYKNISDKMNITLSLPNLLAPFIEKNVVIMDLFEKINQDIAAKTYLQEIIKKADEYKVTIYLEPMPRYKYFLKNIEKRKKVSKEYLIAYYEKFGFKLTPNAQFMKRKFNGNEINIFDETKYDDNGKVCYLKTYTFNDSSISIDYCLDNFFKIDAIGTKEKSRRAGDASKLIDYVKEIAVKNNFQKIDVYLPIDENTPRKEYSLEDYKKAVSFYKKNGFKFYKNSTVKMFIELKTKENENTNGKTEIDTSSNKLLIEKAILYISEGIRTAEKEPREYKKNELIDLEAKLCYNFAVANKLWITDTDILGLPLSGGGNENELYYEEKTGIISKVNNLLNHGASVLNFLQYIQYHNLLFEANSYNLIGFTGFDNEAINIKNAIPYVMPIISQIYVTESVKASINEIKKYMQIIGFEKVDEFTYKNSKYIVSDLRPRNVLKDSEGNIHVIDNIIKINEMKTGGEVENDIKYLTTIEYEDNGKTITWGTKNNRGRETVLNKSNEDILSELEFLKEMIKVGEIDYERAKKYYESISYLGTPKNNQKVKDAFSDMNFTKRTLYVNKNILLPFFEKNLSEKETLQGGAGDKKTIEDIAKKHNVSLDYAEQQLAKGIKIESEHTNDIEKQTEIAIDHLFEFIEYYNELEKMETNLKAKEKPMKNTDIEINSEIVNNYDQVPVVWKNTSEIKEINFINSPFNKDLIKILTPFAGTDELRPIFSGIHCDKNGITVTDAHKLITLPYPNKDFKGTYATFPNTKIISASGAEVKNDIFTNIDYPNYAAVIPKAEDAERVQKISVYKLLQYTEVALHYCNKATNQVIYNLGNLGIGANGKFLIDILETALKLGYKELYAYTTTKSRPIVFSPSKNYALGKDVILLCMPTYIVEEFGDEGTKVYYYGAADLDWGREITAYYDFSKDEIVNKDGSIADFKMNYGEYDVLSSNEIKMLKNFAKNTSLPILEYFRVKDNEISASDLETYLTIKETNLKDGLYKINDNAAEYDSSMTLGNFDMFPNPNEDKSENQIKFIINSEVLLHYINIAIDYTGKDELRPVMTGILFDYKDDKMFMVATDAHKLFKLEITQYVEINKGQKDFQFILSKANLLKFLENVDESSVIVSATINNVTFENDLFKFKSRLIDGRYPNYNAVIPTYKTKKLIINIKDLFSCLKSKEAENFIKANKKEEIRIYNKIGKSNDVFDIFLCYTEYDRAKETHNIVSEIKICQVNYKLEDGNFQIQNNLVLLMPINLALADNFTFDLKYFKVILESLNCENVEMLYDEKNRAYIFGGDCFAYKHTIKAQKSISKPKEVPAKAETKKVEPKESTESNEIEKAIETFEMLVNLGGTKKELKEWSEAIETFKMLVGDDKMKNGGNLQNSFYALTSDGMKNKKKVKILNVQYWKSRETNYTPTLENIKEFLAQVPFDEKIVIYADEDYIDDSTSFYGQLHSAYTPLYTAGAIQVDAIVDENNNIIWNLYAKGKYIINVDDYRFKHGGDLKIVETDNWQIKNANDRYYSVSMQSGNPVWNESPDLGYSYKKEDAENIKNKLIELGNKDLEIVQYNPNWWKMELGGNVLSNNEIIKNIDFSDNTDRKHGRYDFSFETEDNQGANMFDYDGYIIEAPSSSRMNDEIEWGQNVPEDWEKAEKILIDAFYDWKKNKMKNGGDVKTNESDWFWNHAYRHYMRDASLEQRNEVKEQFIKKGLELDGESPRHFEIISNILGEYADGGDINDLTY